MEATIWIDLGGRASCAEHLGAEAGAKLRQRPGARKLATSMTVWEKVVGEEAAEFPCEVCEGAH